MRRYGRWAGRPEGSLEDPERCIASVPMDTRSPLFRQCGNKRGPGNDLCTTHAKMVKRGSYVKIPEES